MKTINSTIIFIIIATISSITPAFSQDNPDEEDPNRTFSLGVGFPGSSQVLQGRIGLGIGPFPDYEGSDNYVAAALPLVDIRKQGIFFIKGASINVNDGLASAGLTLIHMSYSEESTRRMQIVIGPLIRAYRGRDESDNDDLNGLGDIDRGVGIGGFLELNAGPWMASLTVAPEDVGNDTDGLIATFDIDYTSAVSNNLKLSTGLATSWADDDYMQGYYGITDAQAAQTGYRRFDSNAGFKDVGLKFKSSYSMSSRWSLDAQIGYWRLLNDAADSPIVKDKGSANQVRGLVGFLYQF